MRGVEEAGALFAPLRTAPPSARERALRFGPEALTDRELLSAIVADDAHIDHDAAAGTLSARFRGLRSVLAADLSQLSDCVGAHAALTIKLSHELNARAAREQLLGRDVISGWTALLAYLNARLAGRTREAIHVIYLDKRNQLIADEQVSDGTPDFAPLRPRQVIRRALELDASHFVISHVHPSGSPDPSTADVQVTNELSIAAKAVGLALHDHVIIGEGVVFSFKAMGLL